MNALTEMILAAALISVASVPDNQKRLERNVTPVDVRNVMRDCHTIQNKLSQVPLANSLVQHCAVLRHIERRAHKTTRHHPHTT
jgi:hypothetical protein